LEGSVFTFVPKTAFNIFILAARRRSLADIQTLEVRQSIRKNESEKVRYLCIDTSVDRKTEQSIEDRSEESNVVPMRLWVIPLNHCITSASLHLLGGARGSGENLGVVQTQTSDCWCL
jgi:hypothetical protein